MPQEDFSYNKESIISVSKARRILGSLANNYSDDQVRDLLHTLHLLAKEQMWYDGSNKEVSSYESTTTNNQ